MWDQVLFIALAGLLVWMTYRHYQHNPQSFSKENIGKSFNVLGMLALALILFVWLLVWMLKS